MRLLHACHRCKRLFAARLLLLVLFACRAYGQDLSTPLSGSVGDPLYSESTQVGPSGSLLPEGSSLTSPSYRTGTSDPLGTLIETGSMSPYVTNANSADSYANASVSAQALNDPVLVRSLDQYRNNRVLMAGTLATGSLLGRASAAGGSVSNSFAARSQGGGAGFGRDTQLVPFAAGSSAFAHQPAGMLGFVDPNALVSAMTSSSVINATGGTIPQSMVSSQQGTASGSGSGFATTSSSSAAGMSSLGAAMPFAVGTSSMQGGAGGMQATGAVVAGFPVLSVSNPSTTGFADSTQGTAGQATFSDTSSPFRSTRAGSDSDRPSPFPDVSGQLSTYLHPSLVAAAPVRSRTSSSLDPHEYARKERIRAMSTNTGPQQLPSIFEQRATMRAYENQRRRGAPARRSTLTPSITAAP